MDTVNAPENTVFVVNSINLVSNLSDVLITAVGGLLPLLSAATTSAVGPQLSFTYLLASNYGNLISNLLPGIISNYSGN